MHASGNGKQKAINIVLSKTANDKKRETFSKNDDRIKCPSCGKKIVPRIVTKKLQRELKPDRKYQSILVQRLINKSMIDIVDLNMVRRRRNKNATKSYQKTTTRTKTRSKISINFGSTTYQQIYA
jgi:DNA-directed RNA polymerase subunit RPC12/RpoP